MKCICWLCRVLAVHPRVLMYPSLMFLPFNFLRLRLGFFLRFRRRFASSSGVIIRSESRVGCEAFWTLQQCQQKPQVDYRPCSTHPPYRKRRLSSGLDQFFQLHLTNLLTTSAAFASRPLVALNTRSNFKRKTVALAWLAPRTIRNL